MVQVGLALLFVVWLVWLGLALLFSGMGKVDLVLLVVGGGGVAGACITFQLCIIDLNVRGVGGLGTAQQNCIIALKVAGVCGLGTALQNCSRDGGK